LISDSALIERFNFGKVSVVGKVICYDYLALANSDYQVKMVRHQAIRVGFGDGEDIQPNLLQKITKVIFGAKYILEPIGMVENVVAGIGL
jgi:hypothetical protein